MNLEVNELGRRRAEAMNWARLGLFPFIGGNGRVQAPEVRAKPLIFIVASNLPDWEIRQIR
jgi:hypothetical protein